jgi:hypothetical protein
MLTEDGSRFSSDRVWRLLAERTPPGQCGAEEWLSEWGGAVLQEPGLLPEQVERIQQAGAQALERAVRRTNQSMPTLLLTVRIWEWTRSMIPQDPGLSSHSAPQQDQKRRPGWRFFFG